MKNLIAVLALILVCGEVSGQDLERKYYSSQEETYYKNAFENLFQPTDKNKILAFSLPPISISYIQDFTAFKSIYDWSPERKAVFEIITNEDSANPTEGNSGISITDIIKKGELNGNQAILYTDNTYDNFEDAGPGVWITLFDKNRNVWRKFYTGLSEYEPVYLKWNSKLPLFKDQNNLQIEAALIRKIAPEIHPGTPPEYEVVKDGAVVTFDLNKITLDSDNDQLTDVVEAKLGLNPYLKDSDGDKIVDNLDPNPRFNMPPTELSRVYEAILLHSQDTVYNPFNVPIKVTDKMKKGLLPASAETYLLVSDSKDWRSVELSGTRLIVFSNEEYKKHKNVYASTLKQYDVSPLFKVDKMKDTFKLNISTSPLSGFVYLCRKKSTYWEIELISAWAI